MGLSKTAFISMVPLHHSSERHRRKSRALWFHLVATRLGYALWDPRADLPMTFKQGSCCWDSAEHPRRKNLLCEFGASVLSQQSDSRYSVVSQRSKATIFDGNGKGTFSFQAWISPEMEKCQLFQCGVIASSEVVLLLLGAIFNWLALVVIWGQRLMPLVT